MKAKYVAVIPARGGSKGIPKKNLVLLNGQPLILYSLKAALESKYISEIIVSSDDEEILDLSKAYGAVVFKRSDQLSKDNSRTIDSVIELFNCNKIVIQDVIVLLQPTSPLRTSIDIDNAIKLYEDSMLYDKSVVSVIRLPHNYNPNQVYLVNESNSYNMLKEENSFTRQNKLDYIARNGASIYIIELSLLLKNKSFFTTNTMVYEMPKSKSVDIDDSDDLFIAESILRQMID
jgi:CMP-N,N'-diacetyllegionaminic acid synthase